MRSEDKCGGAVTKQPATEKHEIPNFFVCEECQRVKCATIIICDVTVNIPTGCFFTTGLRMIESILNSYLY